MISVKLNVSKVDKTFLFKGKNGMLLDLILIDSPSEYGDGFVKQSFPKEEFERRKQNNIETPIIGNWKRIGKSAAGTRSGAQSKSAPEKPATPSEDDSDSVPF